MVKITRRAVVLLVLAAAACSSAGENTQRDALVGGAVGAGAGAVVGNQLGSSATGAAVGGVAGAATGAIVGYSEDMKFEEKIAAQEEMLRRQQIGIERQNREIEEVKRQKYYNDVMRRFEAPKWREPVR